MRSKASAAKTSTTAVMATASTTAMLRQQQSSRRHRQNRIFQEHAHFLTLPPNSSVALFPSNGRIQKY
jgi:hypothetical protein